MQYVSVRWLKVSVWAHLHIGVLGLAKIGEVFSNLADAHRAYGKAADGIAELSTKLSPQHYSMLLTASAMPTVQIMIPGTLVSPVAAPPPSQAAASTALGRSKIITFTKQQVLLNSKSPELMATDKNSTTHVLAAAVYLKVEQLFFDETSSRLDVATAFHCNASQLTKAVTGIHYKGGPHHYKPKPKMATKRSCDSTDPDPNPAKKAKPKQDQPSTSQQTSAMQKPATVMKEDILSSSSSSSDDSLPPGL